MCKEFENQISTTNQKKELKETVMLTIFDVDHFMLTLVFGLYLHEVNIK